MGKGWKKGPKPTKGLSKSEKKSLKKLPKAQRDLVARAMGGGSTGAKAWGAKLLGSGGGSAEKKEGPAKRPAIAPQQQTAAVVFTKPDQRVLLVGEGNFSFTSSLIGLFKGQGSAVTATGLDSQEVMEKKYSDAAAHVDFATNSGAQVIFDIDGTKLESCTDLDPPYDVVIFNFPHVGLGIKDQQANIEANAQLVLEFLHSALKVVHEKGIICVTVKKGMPYDEWKIPKLGFKVGGLRLKNTVPFDPDAFPGYSHRRTAGYFVETTDGGSDNDIMAHGAHTYIFTPHHEKKKDDDDKEEGRTRGTPGKGKKTKMGSRPKGPNPKGSAGNQNKR